MARAQTAWVVTHEGQYAALVAGQWLFTPIKGDALRLARRADARSIADVIGKGKPHEETFG